MKVELSMNAIQWLSSGERGVSSNTMFTAITGINACTFGQSHPYDPDDFRRCYLLLKKVPEFKSQLDKVAALSHVWKNLVENWDKLESMLEMQMITGKPNGMYKFMKELGC